MLSQKNVDIKKLIITLKFKEEHNACFFNVNTDILIPEINFKLYSGAALFFLNLNIGMPDNIFSLSILYPNKMPISAEEGIIDISDEKLSKFLISGEFTALYTATGKVDTEILEIISE